MSDDYDNTWVCAKCGRTIASLSGECPCERDTIVQLRAELLQAQDFRKEAEVENASMRRLLAAAVKDAASWKESYLATVKASEAWPAALSTARAVAFVNAKDRIADAIRYAGFMGQFPDLTTSDMVRILAFITAIPVEPR